MRNHLAGQPIHWNGSTREWIGGRITVKKLTRGFAFIDAEAFAGDKLLVTATAIFRIFEGETRK